ncbi:hypothetical protein ACFZAD_29690 [Streptomyces iakyrus]|uniref:hypothetical protein n=1 Tax=Streptomyces iakyrus TaxID=68219 RepID=UPI0036F108DC
MSRPILFLDVDGPLNPYAAQPERRPDGYTTLRVPLEGSAAEEHRALSSRRRTLRVWLNPEHGRDLLRLDYVPCPLVEHADGRPFAWVDDEQSDLDQACVNTHHRTHGLLHHVNTRTGLRNDDFRALADFARSLSTSRATD